MAARATPTTISATNNERADPAALLSIPSIISLPMDAIYVGSTGLKIIALATKVNYYP